MCLFKFSVCFVVRFVCFSCFTVGPGGDHASVLPALSWFCEIRECPLEEFEAEARANCVGMAAAAWVRTEAFCAWPWLLLQLPKMQPDARKQLLHDFCNLPQCCLDEMIGEPLREAARRGVDLLSDDVLLLWQTLLNKLKVTNMHLESEFSEMRAAVPVGKGAPPAERVPYQAHLGVLMKDHLAQGKLDCRGSTAETYSSAGVPLERVQRNRASRKGAKKICRVGQGRCCVGQQGRV